MVKVSYVCCYSDGKNECFEPAVVRAKCVRFRKELCKKHARTTWNYWFKQAIESGTDIVQMEWQQL